MTAETYTADDAALDALTAIVTLTAMFLDQRMADGALSRAECADLVRRFSGSDRPNVEKLYRMLAEEIEASDAPLLTVIKGGKSD